MAQALTAEQKNKTVLGHTVSFVKDTAIVSGSALLAASKELKKHWFDANYRRKKKTQRNLERDAARHNAKLRENFAYALLHSNTSGPSNLRPIQKEINSYIDMTIGGPNARMLGMPSGHTRSPLLAMFRLFDRRPFTLRLPAMKAAMLASVATVPVLNAIAEYTAANTILSTLTPAIAGIANMMAAIPLPVLALTPFILMIGAGLCLIGPLNKKVQETENVFRKEGLAVPNFAKAKDAQLYLGFNKFEKLSEEDVLISFASPVLGHSYPEWVMTPYDKEAKEFGHRQRIHAAGFELLWRNKKTMRDIDAIRNLDPAFLNEGKDTNRANLYTKNVMCQMYGCKETADHPLTTFMYMMSALFPENSLEENKEIARKFDSMDGSFRLGETTQKTTAIISTINALNELSRAQGLTLLAGKVTIEDIEIMAANASDNVVLNEDQAKDVIKLIAHKDLDLPIHRIMEAVIEKDQWGSDYLEMCLHPEVSQQLEDSALEEIARHCHKGHNQWGQFAKEIITFDYTKNLSFDEIKDIAFNQKTWGQSYHNMHQYMPEEAASLSHEALKRIALLGPKAMSTLAKTAAEEEETYRHTSAQKPAQIPSGDHVPRLAMH